MKSPGSETKPWSNGKWAVVVSLIFTLHVLFELRLSSSARISARPAAPQKTWLLASPPPSGSRWAETMVSQDPTLFARGSALGFSGEAWLNRPPATHRLADWTNAPFWLQNVTNSFGAAFRTYVQTNLPILADIAAATEPPPFKLAPLNSLLATQSELSVEGELARWEPVLREPLPLIAQTEFITNSVVELLADRKGRLLSHTLLHSSGSRAADEWALKSARHVQWRQTNFTSSAQPSHRPAPLSGRFIFHWRTAPMTNPPSNGISAVPRS